MSPRRPEFLQLVKQAGEKYGALYIADEVQSGAGRTGKMWAIEYSGVVPDMLTWGKGMGGDMPMAGVTFTRISTTPWQRALNRYFCR